MTNEKKVMNKKNSLIEAPGGKLTEYRVWLYYRMDSEKVDIELMDEQLFALTDFIHKNSYKAVNKTADRDNGTNICRSALHEIYESAFAGELDILLVMDMAHICPIESKRLFFQRILKKRGVDIIELNKEEKRRVRYV